MVKYGTFCTINQASLVYPRIEGTRERTVGKASFSNSREQRACSLFCTINQASLIYPRIKGSGTLPSSFNCMSALSEKRDVPRPSASCTYTP